MKSKILGASLALGLIAVGITSCYDSVNESVVVPAKPAAPEYQVTGIVTDYLTEEGLKDFTISGAFSASIKGGNGFYDSGLRKDPINGPLKFESGGYKDVTIPVHMEQITTGLLAYNLNVALKKDGYIEGVLVTVVSTENGESVTKAVEYTNSSDGVERLNLNEHNITFTLPWGVECVGSPSDEFKAYLKVYNVTNFKFESKELPEDISIAIPARSKVTSVTATPIIQTERYTMPVTGDLLGEVKRVVAYHVVPNTISLDHTHGHSHGHGDDNNAGGGIFGAE